MFKYSIKEGRRVGMKKKLLILILLNSLMISFIACQEKPNTEKETEVETMK